MNDLISRQRVLFTLTMEINLNLSDAQYDRMVKAINSVPSEQKLKKGKWIGKPIAGYSNVRCSNCNNVYIDNSGKWNYCPNCGADMREEIDDIPMEYFESGGI